MFVEPFGQADCESEVAKLQERYSEIYFDETPFNSMALDPSVYLIIGRRGSGKSALAQSFSFQNQIANPICIEVHKPAVFHEVMTRLAQMASQTRVSAVAQLRDAWGFVIWSTIFQQLKPHIPGVEPPCNAKVDEEHGVSSIVARFFDYLTDMLKDETEQTIGGSLKAIVDAAQLDATIKLVLDFAKKRPVIVTFDTLEKYDIRDDGLMNAMAALIEFAEKFNVRYSDRGVHFKLLVSGEVFPYLNEVVMPNPLKGVKRPVYLLWRPKDLLRLIGWRFCRYLVNAKCLPEEAAKEIRWEKHNEVFNAMWLPFFGRELKNRRNLPENTFAYVLRHTQMRPRQLILICNAIAQKAHDAGQFPRTPGGNGEPVFDPQHIVGAVREIEATLANEILNSFSAQYTNVEKIVEALSGIPMMFKGSELDRRAKKTKKEWKNTDYSLPDFRQLVAELGIVGRVTRTTDGYVDADFEYSTTTRVPITDDDDCVIHPMFYTRLQVKSDQDIRVMPFSTARREIDELQKGGKA